MFGGAFGHGTLRKYVIYFGTLFNNIYLNRYNQSGTLIQNMRVPLNYGPREKFLARLDGDRNLERPIAIQLPRMAFSMTSIYYDATRKGQTLNKITAASSEDSGKKIYQYSPVPYNIEFELSIMVKNAEDGTYIVEQILPYFTPDWTATLNLNPDLGMKYDVPIILENIQQTDQYEGDFIQRRALIWTLSFVMKGWLFGPTKSNGGKIIKDIDINLTIPPYLLTTKSTTPQNSDPAVEISITPGQYANGDAVSWYGDPSASIRPSTVNANTITANSEYGFIIDFIENT